MRSFDAQRLAQLEDPARLQRLSPFVTDGFDTLSLERPGFLAEIGLQADDEAWLRAASAYRPWALSPGFGRAFVEESRARKLEPAALLESGRELRGEALWRQGERLLRRLDQIVEQPAKALGVTVAVQEQTRRNWQGADQQAILEGLLLHLRGAGPAPKPFLDALQSQAWRRFFWFFRRPRPTLSQVQDRDIEITVPLVSSIDAARVYFVQASFAQELQENSSLSPELWARQWSEYLKGRQALNLSEFQALLDHFQDQDRYLWPNLVALSGAKARRAIAAIALLALQRLQGPEDTPTLERLWQMSPDFAERYELQQVLKKSP